MLIQKSMGVDVPFFHFRFFVLGGGVGLEQTSENTGGAMKKTNVANSLHILSARSLLLQSSF